MANIPRIILNGGEAYASEGTDQSSGTRLFCLSGRVALTGLYEFEFGATLAEVLDAAGGFRGLAISKQSFSVERQVVS